VKCGLAKNINQRGKETQRRKKREKREKLRKARARD